MAKDKKIDNFKAELKRKRAAPGYRAEQQRKEDERKKRAADRKTKYGPGPLDEIIEKCEERQYISKLERAIIALPTKPPSNWNKENFKKAQRKAKLIIKRLKPFLDA